MRGTWRIKQMLERRRLRRAYRDAEIAVREFPVTRRTRPHGLSKELIVSLTSYPRRFSRLDWTIKGLLDQEVKPDRTILWLANDDVDLVPTSVLHLQKHGLEIKVCDDIGSYKKLIPALSYCPEAIIVTADDDVYYPPCWLSGMVEAHRLYPARIIAWRAHVARSDVHGRIARYTNWGLATDRVRIDGPRAALFPTGVGGVLYPPRSLHRDVMQRDEFMKLCPRADDVWFYWMARRAGVRHARVDGWLDLIEWPDTQQFGLCVDNLAGNGNDEQIASMERRYGSFPF